MGRDSIKDTEKEKNTGSAEHKFRGKPKEWRKSRWGESTLHHRIPRIRHGKPVLPTRGTRVSCGWKQHQPPSLHYGWNRATRGRTRLQHRRPSQHGGYQLPQGQPTPHGKHWLTRGSKGGNLGRHGTPGAMAYMLPDQTTGKDWDSVADERLDIARTLTDIATQPRHPITQEERENVDHFQGGAAN